MQFIKYHGLGNDFIMIIGGMTGHPPVSADEAQTLCQRGHGIGADGVMLARPSSSAHLRMELTNSDGSLPEMCGNGLRCFVKYAIEELGLTHNPLDVETPGGIRRCRWQAATADTAFRCHVDMGKPSFERELIPMRGEGSGVGVDLEIEGTSFHVVGVNTGNPHMVIFGDASTDIATRWGPLLTKHPMFPEGANVEFAEIDTPNAIRVTVWERGCGLTQACGTGASATAAAAVKLGLSPANTPITVALPGGCLRILVEPGLTRVWMDGPAVEVYRGDR